jgi:hypothetical protein
VYFSFNMLQFYFYLVIFGRQIISSNGTAGAKIGIRLLVAVVRAGTAVQK